MKRWIEIKEFEVFDKVKFYTVCFEDDDESETDKFFRILSKNPNVLDKLQRLVALIKNMGNRFGAHKDFFRPEAAAEALPPKSSIARKYKLVEFIDYDLRLFCVRLSDSVVVLFNGGQKTTAKAQDCPNIAPKFRMAQIFANKIDEKIRDRDFIIEYKSIIADDYTIEI